MSHYHIRWSGQNKMDWERFESEADAVTAAKQLVRPGETYTIEERDETCEDCRAGYISKIGRESHEAQPKIEQPTVKYLWQKAVLDAFTEMRPEFLPLKINQAQRAISARLSDDAPADLEEQLALRDALNSLRALFPQPVKPNSSQKKATA